MGTESQQMFGVGLGSRLAGENRNRSSFALERMHEGDRDRWIVLSRFATKTDAERALAELVARGEEPHLYRVRKVR